MIRIVATLNAAIRILAIRILVIRIAVIRIAVIQNAEIQNVVIQSAAIHVVVLIVALILVLNVVRDVAAIPVAIPARDARTADFHEELREEFHAAVLSPT